MKIKLFQSTLPVWGATRQPSRGGDTNGHFNPRSPCGERLKEMRKKVNKKEFQSTLPVWGATRILKPRRRMSIFQSTLPVWGATDPLRGFRRRHQISIHAPRVGSDNTAWPM